MRDAALARLEWLLREASRPDPDQWRPGHEYLEGALLAYKRIGVLSRSEEERWRARFARAATERDAEPQQPLPGGRPRGGRPVPGGTRGGRSAAPPQPRA